MRIINVAMYIGLIGCVAIGYRNLGSKRFQKYKEFIKSHSSLMIVLFVFNSISFAMTFVSVDSEFYIKKGEYGAEDYQIPLLLEKEETTEEMMLEVEARRLTEEELEQTVTEAFLYLEKNMKGENSSFLEIRSPLDYSLDYKKYPFDMECISSDYALLDGEGIVKNETEELLALGYDEKEIQQGIEMELLVTLWYGENRFEKTFLLKIFPREKTEMEKQFDVVKKKLREVEQQATYEEGFYVPANIEKVRISRQDKQPIKAEHILCAGLILAVLLLLREQENIRREKETRTEQLLRSYPWFVNEMVLLLGAGMQVRNIFSLLCRSVEVEKRKEDYRRYLLEELEKAVHAMELGMNEEQAYYHLGRQIGIPCYIKVMTLLEQNVKRGAKGLTTAFEQEELFALEERKNIAKRYGEQAGTKLLGPMLLLLLIVMFIIMIPAFWGFV